MGLVRCPDCGKNISDSAPACIGCGRPMGGAPTPGSARSASPMAESPRAGPQCGKCGGTEFRKFSQLYEESAQGGALGIASGGGGGVGAGGMTPPGMSLAALARRVAPPVSKQGASGSPVSPVLVAIAVAAGLVAYAAAGFAWGLVAFTVTLFGGVAVAGRRSAPWPEVERSNRAAYAEWDRKYLCMQCGAVARASGGEGQPLMLKTDQGNEELDELIRAGQKIQAIKHLRESTDLGLAEAKAAVEAREREL